MYVRSRYRRPAFRAARVAKRRYAWEHLHASVAVGTGVSAQGNLLTGLEAVSGVDLPGIRIERVHGVISMSSAAAQVLAVAMALGVRPAALTEPAGGLYAGSVTYEPWHLYLAWDEPAQYAAATPQAAFSSLGFYSRAVDLRSKRLLRGINDEYRYVVDNAGAGTVQVAFDLAILTSR